MTLLTQVFRYSVNFRRDPDKNVDIASLAKERRYGNERTRTARPKYNLQSPLPAWQLVISAYDKTRAPRARRSNQPMLA